MYDIQQCQNAKSAKDYLAHDEIAMRLGFGGKSFQHMGVDPAEMTRLKFNNLIDNRHPITGKKLTPRDDPDRICGHYHTFSAPKSVTLAAEFSPQKKEVQDAILDAALHAMKTRVEPTAQARVRKGGKCGDKTTGNLAWMWEYHTLSREVDGKSAPQHHVHVFTVNATHDGDGFKAVKLRQAFFQSTLTNRSFHKRLRENLENIGIETRGFGAYWSVSGIDRATELKFSPRRSQAMQNIEDGVRRKVAGLHGRAPKRAMTQEDMAGLRDHWRSMLNPREWQCLQNLAPRPKWGRILHPDHSPRFDFMRYVERVKDALTPRRPEVSRDGPER